MKRFFTFVLATLAFAACTQNEFEEHTADRNDIPGSITVGFEGGDTRVQLNDIRKTVWNTGDEVSVFYRSDINQKWAFQGETGDRTGELKLVEGEGGEQTMDKTVVVYPYNANYQIDINDGGVETSLAGTQKYKERSYGEDGNIMVAESSFTQFILRSVVGWLRVELTGEGKSVSSITVRGNNDEQVAGLIYINTEDASITLASSDIATDESILTEVTLDCGEGVELGSEPTEFYIAVLPQAFAEGITIEVDCAGYRPMTLSTESSITIERNHIVPMEAVEHNAEEIDPTNELRYTATALVEPDEGRFEVDFVSNEWDETTGEGVIVFDGKLTEIGDSAFSECSSLTSVTIPDSVTTIGEYAFSDCKGLTSITIPDSVTIIGEKAFIRCSNLASVKISSNITTIGEYTFAFCKSLTSITIPSKVTTIERHAFAECRSLTSVTIPGGVTAIGEKAFYICNNLTSVYISDIANWCNITFNGEYSNPLYYGDLYFNNELVTDLIIPNGVTTIRNMAFHNCDSLTSVTIPDSVTTIGEWAFRDCNSLTSVTIGDSVTTIGDRAFGFCTSLPSITIPDSVTTIGESAFYCCYDLLSITIPDSVTSIGENAFSSCNNIKSVYCKPITPPAGGSGMLSSLTTIYVPEGSLQAYKSAEYWSDYADIIAEYDYNSTMTISYTTSDGMPASANGLIISNNYQNGVGILSYIGKDIIPAGLFFICDNLTSVTIPDGVTTIGSTAFVGCNSLPSITIPDSVTMIGSDVFETCLSLTSVWCKAIIPPTLSSNRVFYENKSGRKIYVPAESVDAYKAAEYWNNYSLSIVAYDYERGEVVE